MPVPNVHKTQSKKKKSVASRKELSILWIDELIKGFY
jgi:hypothetical protein